MPNQIINTFGLLLNIAGVVILFLYVPPQPNLEEGVNLGVEDATIFEDGTSVAQINVNIRKLKKRHEIFSRIALIFIFFGFILQLWATWVI
jgi:hypothetical protein